MASQYMYLLRKRLYTKVLLFWAQQFIKYHCNMSSFGKYDDDVPIQQEILNLY